MTKGGYWQKRTGRRPILRGLAAGTAGLAAATMIACGESKQATTVETPAVKQPKRGGIVSRAGGQAGTYDTRGIPLDPHIATRTAAIGFRLVYQGLLAYDLHTLDVEPELAEKWEQPSETEYVFTLANGVKWHNKAPANGRGLTADDIKFSLDRVRTDQPQFQSRSLLSSIDKIEAVGTNRVRITTKTPDAPFLSKLSGDPIMIMAPEVVEKAGKFSTPDSIVGTGAFIIKSFQEGVSGEYVRNPDYWKPGLPYLDGVRTADFGSDDLAYAAVRAGQVDICLLPGTEVKEYLARQSKDFVPDWYKDQGFQIAQANTKRKPLDDARLPKALRLLMDHTEFITGWGNVWFGGARHGSVFAPAMDEWDLSHEEYAKLLEWKQPKDEAVREAMSLLSASGFNTANPLKFELTGQTPGSFGEALTVLLQAQWKRLSQGVVDTSARVLGTPQDVAARDNRQFDYWVGGGSGSIPEPDAFLSQMFYTNASRNYSGISDPKLDAMIDKQRSIMNIPQRKTFVREVLLYLIDNSPSVVPTLRYFLNAVNPKLQGYSAEFFMAGAQYERLWLDT